MGSAEETCLSCPSEGFTGPRISYRTWPHSVIMRDNWRTKSVYTYVVAPFAGTFNIKVSTRGWYTTSIIIWNSPGGQWITGKSEGNTQEITLRLKEGQRAKIRMKCPGTFGGKTCDFDVDSRLYNFKHSPGTSYCGASDMIKLGNSVSTDYSQ
jgi:hypothetical protein